MDTANTFIQFASKRDFSRARAARIVPVHTAFDAAMTFERTSPSQVAELRDRLLSLGITAEFCDTHSGEELHPTAATA